MSSFKWKLGIGIVVSYTTYSYYVSYRKSVYMKQKTQDDMNSHKIGGQFINPFHEYKHQSILEFFYIRILELFLPKENLDEIKKEVPLHKPDLDLYRHNSTILKECLEKGVFGSLTQNNVSALPPINDQLLFTWLGQSCSLVQVSGLNFLTDPLFEDHIINSKIGPKRLIPSPLAVEEVPVVDYILVSHNHPDHLDLHLVDKFSGAWLVPLGMKKVLSSNGVPCDRIVELDWWDRRKLLEVDNDVYEIVCLPSMHWSGRYLYDANTSLWCSFLVLKNGKSIFYHVGDTGYSKELFSKIKESYGSIKLGILPIGQYCPEWHQHPRHISPKESLQIVQELNINKMVGVHWGTFKLSFEPFMEPKNLLETQSRELNKEKDYFVPSRGKTYVYDMEGSGETEHITVGESIFVKG